MKIRNGFVSNSSSSSFLIAFNKVPESREDIKEFLFKDQKESDYIAGYDRNLPVSEAIDRIWYVIKNESKIFNSIESFFPNDIENNFDNAWHEDIIQEVDRRGFSRKNDHAAYFDEVSRVYVEKQIESFNEYMKPFITSRFFENGGVMIEVCFSDEGGYPDSIIEHSDIFREVPCQICSHH